MERLTTIDRVNRHTINKGCLLTNFQAKWITIKRSIKCNFMPLDVCSFLGDVTRLQTTTKLKEKTKTKSFSLFVCARENADCTQLQT
jgi:hypothetical protein